jgi:hypothetical protein
MKLIKWLAAILATAIGILEVVVKFLKELLTLIVDVLYPIIPADKFKAIVDSIRSWVNGIYEWLSQNKEKVIAYLNLLA